MTLLLLRSSLWSNLPDELVMEVFNRLPENKLLGLRCVSKKYHSLISNLLCPKLAASASISGFVFQWKATNKKIHLHKRVVEDDTDWNYSYVTPSGSFAPYGGELVKSYLSLLPFKPKRKDFLGCFNGFFLVRYRDSSAANTRYFVCNPVTRQCVTIPINNKKYKKNQDWFVRLAFDPLLGTNEQQRHNFKVVRIHRNNKRKSHHLIVDIFSSALGKWDSYPVAFDSKTVIFGKWTNKHSVYANGVLYTLSLAGYLLCFNILAMDNDNNKNTSFKSRAIRLPHTSIDDPLGFFEASRGCLYYICRARPEFLVWTFQANEAASPWTLKYSISCRDFHPIGNIIAVDLKEEIIYNAWWCIIGRYDIKNKHQSKQMLKIEGVSSKSSTRFSAYSCCLLKLADHFSETGQIPS